MMRRIGTIKEIWRYPVKSMRGESLHFCEIDKSGVQGDRAWALRDEKTGEITNAKRLPLILQCAASYVPDFSQDTSALIKFPDGSELRSNDPAINSRMSEFLDREVTIWPLQPPEDKQHYRRKTAAARTLGKLAKYSAVRAALPALTSFGKANRELREIFSREPDEPVPDVSALPPEVLEFTSPPGTYFDAFSIHLLTSASLQAMSAATPNSSWDVLRFRPNFLIETDSDLSGLIESKWNGELIELGDAVLKCEIPTVRCGMTTHAQGTLPKDSAILRSIVRNADQNLGTYASVVRSSQVKVGDVVRLDQR